MRHLRNFFLAGEDANRVEKCLHHIYLSVFLTVLGGLVGVLSLLLTAHAYSGFDAQETFFYYLQNPVLCALNVAPAVVLIWAGYFLFRHAWAAYLFSAIPCLQQ